MTHPIDAHHSLDWSSPDRGITGRAECTCGWSFEGKLDDMIREAGAHMREVRRARAARDRHEALSKEFHALLDEIGGEEEEETRLDPLRPIDRRPK